MDLISMLCMLALVGCVQLVGGKVDSSKSSAVHTKGCPPSFLDRCTCGEALYQQKRQYVVNCTNAGFTDTTALTHLPQATEILIFTGNSLSELTWNILGEPEDGDGWNLGVHLLKVMDLSNNKIRNIPGKTFHRVSSVERLILNHNNIVLSKHKNHPRMFSNFINLKELHLTNAFSDPGESDEDDEDDDSDEGDGDEEDDEKLPNGGPSPSYLVQLEEIFKASNLSKLEKIHLEQNEIETFTDVPELFCRLPSLADLHLGDNKISGLNGLDLSCLPRLRFLDLEKNNIEFLPKETLDSWDHIMNNRLKPAAARRAIDPLFMVDLGGNPLACNDCEKMVPLSDWMQKTKVSVRNKEFLACQGLHNIHCPDVHNAVSASKTSDEEGHSSVGVAITVFMCLSIIALAIGAAYINRSWINTKMYPMIQSVTTKVQYTTIGRQEDEVREINV